MAILRFRTEGPTKMAGFFLEKGFGLTQVKHQEKRPVASNWQRDYITDPKNASKFQDSNLGIIWGVPPHYPIDIDLDCPEAVALAPHFLSPTPWVFGHKSTPRSHYVYRSKDVKTAKFSSPVKDDGGMVLEVRSTGAQTIAPGSIHPSGEPIYFYSKNWRSELPTIVDKETLQQQAGDLAAACLVLRHGWQAGKRDEVAVALCGLMLRANRTPEHVNEFLSSIARAAGDEELDMRLKAEYQLERLAKDEKVPGIPSLIKHLGSDLATTVVDWLGVKSINVVNEFNQEMCLIPVGGKTRVLIDAGKLASEELQLMAVPDARNLYLNRGNVPVGKRQMTKFDYWMQSPERRSYSRLVFSPDGVRNGEYNLWQGWSIKPVNNPKGCKRFLDHVKEVICSGDEDLTDYVMCWMADAVQHPGVKPGVALVMQSSEEGTGKTMFARYFLRIFGKYGIISTNQDHLFGKHNFHLANRLVVFADESVWAGNRHHRSVLNNLITADTLSIEPKGVNSFNLSNYLRLIMSTNNDWAVPASDTARRFAVMQVSNHRLRNWDYFKALEKEELGHGPACLMQYLLDYPINRSLRDIPQTEALMNNKLLTMEREDPIQAWWYHRLREGSPLRRSHTWLQRVSRSSLHADYQMYSGRTAEGKGDQTSFGMKIRRLIPQLQVTRNITPESKGQQIWCYSLPSLEECRKFFESNVVNQKIAWDKA